MDRIATQAERKQNNSSHLDENLLVAAVVRAGYEILDVLGLEGRANFTPQLLSMPSLCTVPPSL
jgi:hypothetical protein